jgi:hypothetical protein
MIAACTLLFAQASLAAPMKVTVSKVQGTVQVQDGAAWKTLKDGDTVKSGAEVKTGAGSSCLLKWAGGNVVKVGPMSNLTVTAEKSGADEKSKVDLKNGKVSAHAKKLGTGGSSFNVSTPTAVAGVRGTDIIAEIAAGNVSFGVSDGQLEMSVGGKTFVLEDGFLLKVDPEGGFSEPIPIPPVMMQELKIQFDALKEEAASDAALGGNDEDSDEDADEDSDEDSDEDADADSDEDSDMDADADSDEDMDMGMDEDFEDVTDNIDDILDNEDNNDIVDAAINEYITGAIEVIINLDPATPQ